VNLWDVNILVYAFRADAPHHAEYRGWVERSLATDEPFGYSDLVLSGFIRVVTHPRVFREPDGLDDAIAYADSIRRQPGAVEVRPGARHWEIFRRLCERVDARGNLIPDAFHAALAIESGSTWVTSDRDYSRFPGLRVIHPLDEERG
jgi:hypothetical protein